ncbi:MAG: 1-deoxy-D-xylulose-5-phosphate reductoisomerase [Chitinophagaceae bacterium]|nr:1-deoxy-D-xylulose-5-phosphate reductoisomerase [Chitinophagaceae bacterium]
MNSEKRQKRIAIFGSTGSIGTQALEVIAANPDLFSAEILTAQSNDELLVQQALQFIPNAVVIGDEKKYTKVKEALAATDVKVFAGEKALEEVAAMDCYDMMLAAIVGYAGLKPTIRAVQAGKAIALANKETLVVAGDIVMKLAVENRLPVIPVDSEHSAIFQCLVGETRNRIEKIILTASGGPFIGRKPNYLVNVKREHALQHPNWSMGAKITIDSATLMNKGLEMIEAKWLFNLKPEQIQVVIHPQSIIHSMVQFEDGSIKAQRGGNLPCVMNAANEIAVFAFLRNRVNFLDMTNVIEKTMEMIPFIANPTLEEYFESDGEARNFAADIIKL